MKYLGIDFGLRKIGLAISEGELSSPYGVLYVKNKADAIEKIEDVVRKENISQVVIGLPESGILKTILKVITELRLNIPVEIVDETLSSQKAKERMLELGIKKEKRIDEDAYSAALILQDYLDTL